MKTASLCAVLMGTTIVLTSFALSTARPAAKTGPAWTVSQYQLDRAFRNTLPNTNNTQTITVQLPMTGGLIVTQVGGCTISVNGVSEVVPVAQGNPPVLLNPPIIARPGDVFAITYVGQPVIAGYTTLPGETCDTWSPGDSSIPPRS